MPAVVCDVPTVSCMAPDATVSGAMFLPGPLYAQGLLVPAHREDPGLGLDPASWCPAASRLIGVANDVVAVDLSTAARGPVHMWGRVPRVRVWGRVQTAWLARPMRCPVCFPVSARIRALRGAAHKGA